MTNTFIDFSDSLVQSGRVGPEIAEELKATMERFLALSQKASREVEEETDIVREDSNTSTAVGVCAETAVPSSTALIDFKSPAVPPTSHPDYQTIPPPFKEETAMAMSRVTPNQSLVRFGSSNAFQFEFGTPDPYMNGIWGLHTEPSPSDGTSAIPYILAGRDSFASRLYFETMYSAVRSLRGDISRDFANSIFRYKMHYVSTRKIFAVVAGVLNMLLHGTSQPQMGDPTFEDFEPAERIKAAIVNEVVACGGSEADYVGAWDVERYLRDKWALALDSNSVRVQSRAVPQGPHAAHSNPSDDGTISAPDSPDNHLLLAPTFIPGFPSSGNRVLDASELVEKLRAQAVTIGEGPRWHVGSIDEVVQDFLHYRRPD